MIGYAVLGGFVLDAVFGDPAWLPHPVVYMGKAISALEKGLRARLPKTPEGELWGGRILAFCLPVGTFALTSLVCMEPLPCTHCWDWQCRCSGADRHWRQRGLCRRVRTSTGS